MKGDENANVIYLVILLVFVMSSFLVQARGRSAEMWKAARIWGMIVAIIVVLVSFRGELNLLKDRILGEVNPSAAQSKNGVVRIRKSADGHFHVDAMVNGQAVNFIVDTGASNITLNKSDAAKVGVDINALRYNGTAFTANGHVQTADIILDQITIGSIQRTTVSAEVNNGEMSGSLLGMSFLNNLSGFSVHGDELVLQP